MVAGVCRRLSGSVTLWLASRQLHLHRPGDDVMPPAV